MKNTSHNAKKRSALFLAALALCLFALALPALPQADMKVVNNEDLSPHTRPLPVFKHDSHNEKAKIEDCATCHHGEKDGKIDMSMDSTDQSCVECHAVNAKKGVTPLKRAFHRQCIGCHEQVDAGPTYCGGCHKG